MMNRELKEEILRLGGSFQVLMLTGPRQSGKTTLCKMAFPHYKYVNLENPDTQAWVEADPTPFLKQDGTSMILDEAQQLPDLFSYIQVIADEDRSKRKAHKLYFYETGKSPSCRVPIPVSIGKLRACKHEWVVASILASRCCQAVRESRNASMESWLSFPSAKRVICHSSPRSTGR